MCEAQVAYGFITSFAIGVWLHSKHNRQLLWHGSRITNFTGILSQGLRIAPPEAPVQGYMFGKGIYAAGTPSCTIDTVLRVSLTPEAVLPRRVSIPDMVSKSANYCFANSSNPIVRLRAFSLARRAR